MHCHVRSVLFKDALLWRLYVSSMGNESDKSLKYQWIKTEGKSIVLGERPVPLPVCPSETVN
jgi:hypothetical protein